MIYTKRVVGPARVQRRSEGSSSRIIEAHEHSVRGTVTGIDGTKVTVRTGGEKTVTVVLNADTKVTEGSRIIAPASVKVGDRVFASGPEDRSMIITAETVRVGAPPT